MPPSESAPQVYAKDSSVARQTVKIKRALSGRRGDDSRGPRAVSLIVLDASVAVKWFLPEKVETLATEALALLDRCGKNEIQIIVPDLFWVEFTSVLWKAIRRGNFPKASADAALTSLKRFDFPTVPSLKLLDSAFEIATAYGRTVYDGLYVALAVQTNSQLITADERLANSLAACF